MKSIETYGTVTNGKLTILEKEKFIQKMKELEGMELKVSISKVYDPRSPLQNGYYWGCIIDLFLRGWMETQGEQIAMEEAHEILKHECNYTERINPLSGEIIRKGKSTTDMSTVDFEEYLERCRRFIWEWFAIIVPLPDKEWKKKKELEFSD